MKKFKIIVLMMILLSVNATKTQNVYGQSFKLENTEISIFDMFGNSEMTKYNVEKNMGYSYKSEKLFHSIYDCTIDGINGEMKIRYDDDPGWLQSNEITNNIDDNILVGRVFWKEKGFSREKEYSYQIQGVNDINYNMDFEETLKMFGEIPEKIDDVKNNEILVYYDDYSMYGEKGTLMLTFKNNKLQRNYVWMFDIPEEKGFSDYSSLICQGWLKNLSQLLDYAETTDVETSYDRIYLLSLRKLDEYYLDIFKKNNRTEMEIFDRALRNYYLDFCSGEENKFVNDIDKWKEILEAKGETVDTNKMVKKFIQIWKDSGECKFSWDEIIELDDSPYHSIMKGQPVRFYDKIMDENNQVMDIRKISISYNPEEMNLIL